MNWRAPLIRVGLALIGSAIPQRLRTIRLLGGLGPAELDAQVDLRLRRLLLHAARQVPYYRTILADAGVVTADRINLDAWAAIPVLTKAVLRTRFDDLKSADLRSRRWFVNHSGGSTGEPARMIQDRSYHQWNVANKLYYRDFAGQQIGWPELRFWSSERDLFGTRRRPVRAPRDWVFNRTDLNTFCMTKDDMASFVAIWTRVRPTWIEGYAVTLREFARFVTERKITLPAPLGIVSSAETLSPRMRQAIEQAFKAPVLNRYGSREVGDIACSCATEPALHISTWNNYVEVLDSEGHPVSAGQIGRVVVTNLNNYAMPLIRYEIGDLASPAASRTCSCGRATPRLERVEGRLVSVFRRLDGTVVSGGYFIHLIGSAYDSGVVRRFQVIQRQYDHIEIRLVIANASELNTSWLEERVRAAMGPECRVTWTFVDDIPPLASGKYEYTRTEI